DGRWYGLALNANPTELTREVDRRKVFVFVIDREGKGIPLYPSLEMGDVENVFPTSADTRDGELPITKQLRPAKLSQIGEPFGTDTYILLTLAPNDSIDLENLSWTRLGVKSKRLRGGALEQLLSAV